MLLLNNSNTNSKIQPKRLVCYKQICFSRFILLPLYKETQTAFQDKLHFPSALPGTPHDQYPFMVLRKSKLFLSRMQGRLECIRFRIRKTPNFKIFSFLSLEVPVTSSSCIFSPSPYIHRAKRSYVPMQNSWTFVKVK